MSRQREADEAAGSAAVERRTPVVRGPAPVALALAGNKLRFVTFWDSWLLAQAERKIPELARP